jgi:hypothetical protein
MSDLGYPSWDPGISCPCVWNLGCPPSWELPGPILANVSKWPFYCPDAKMTDLGSSCHCPVLPEIHQNTPFRSPVPILAVYTLIHMGNCVYLTRKLAIITLKSPKMASKTPKMAIPEAGLVQTGRGTTQYHMSFAPPAGPQVPNKWIGPNGPIRVNIGH